jgi:hypothetical protein
VSCSRPEQADRRPSARLGRALGLTAALWVALAVTLGCDGAPKKKLIEFGWDEPDTAYLRRQIGRMEQMPFDGCVFHVMLKPHGSQDVNLAWRFWGRTAFAFRDSQQAREDLWKTPRQRFRHNFLRLNVTPGDVDWYDDFSAILANARLAAAVAREGGCAGILLDTEPYEAPLFDYRRRPSSGRRSWEEYAAQARRRGREIMHAFEQTFPGSTVLLTFGYELPWIESNEGARPLAQCATGLLAPFLDGLLDGCRRGRVVDGYELTYGVRDGTQFAVTHAEMRQRILPAICASGPGRGALSLGFGLWLDYDWRRNGWSSASTARNHFTPQAFEASLAAALGQADEYVWVYSETPRWWSAEGGPRNLPPAYIDAVWRARRAAGLD